ncbi:MAG: hypothetical protein ACREBU_00235 [Nitrososphaera sp.]
MATLDPEFLATVRNSLEKEGLAINYTKKEINMASQTVEDFFENNRILLNTQIDVKLVPFVMSSEVKDRIIHYVLNQKFGQSFSDSRKA